MQCADCQGRGWVARRDTLLSPGEHPDYPDGLTETWWEPCERCNAYRADGTRSIPDPPDAEP